MPAERVLRLIPDLEVQRVERGCCGMAGFWGFQQKNYRHSLQIGTPLFRALRQPDIQFGVSDCSSCCVQMEHGSRKRAYHPIRLLAVAYGFLPSAVLER
jgi:Fe-S oxidoreductase